MTNFVNEEQATDQSTALNADTEGTTIKTISINRMAITLLDMDNTRLIPAKEVMEIEIENNPTFSKFFSDHIKNTRTSPKSKECVFDDQDANIITKIERYKRKSIEKSESTNEFFLQFANDIAQLFFAKFRSTSSKSNGSLFIIDASVSAEDKIILLKIDPQNAIQLKVIEEKLGDETKDIKVTLKEILDVLPHDEKSIHKSSIININFDEQTNKLLLPENETHLFVLDNQRSGDPSRFFIKDFLDATPIPDDEFKTMRAMETFTKFLSEKFSNIDSHEIIQSVSAQFPNNSFVQLKNIGETLLKRFYTTNENQEYITGEKDENGADILAPIEEDIEALVSSYTSNNEDYSTGFLVVRNESKITYRSKQVLVRFDKVLKGDKVTVTHNEQEDTYTFTVKNAKDLGFSLDLK